VALKYQDTIYKNLSFGFIMTKMIPSSKTNREIEDCRGHLEELCSKIED